MEITSSTLYLQSVYIFIYVYMLHIYTYVYVYIHIYMHDIIHYIYNIEIESIINRHHEKCYLKVWFF